MGSYEENASQKSFKDDLKQAFKLAKNRYHKEKHKAKQGNAKDAVVDSNATNN